LGPRRHRLRDAAAHGSLRGKSVHLNMGGFLYANAAACRWAWCCPRTTCTSTSTATQPADRGGSPGCRPAALAPGRQARRLRSQTDPGGGAKDIPSSSTTAWPSVERPAPRHRLPIRTLPGPATAMGRLLAVAARASAPRAAASTRADLQRHSWNRCNNHTTGRTWSSCATGRLREEDARFL